MGGFTLESRENFQQVLVSLRNEYQATLRDKGRKAAFNMLVSAWCQELGAFTYAESIPLVDLILLTNSLENQSILDDIQSRLARLEGKSVGYKSNE